MAQVQHDEAAGLGRAARPASRGPTANQRAWLARGLEQPGGKLPLFDGNGKKIDPRTINRCIEAGWAEPWFTNTIKPDWLVCKLTDKGSALAQKS